MNNSAFDIFALLNPPLWLVTSQYKSERGGLIATFVNQASISLEHPRVLIGLARTHHTWELVEASGMFVLHLISEDHIDLVWEFGLQSTRNAAKFADIEIVKTPLGLPRLEQANAWMECRVEESMQTGDRTIYLAEVTAAELLRSGRLLTQKRMLELASPDKLQQLKEQMFTDRQFDAVAIEQWRNDRS